MEIANSLWVVLERTTFPTRVGALLSTASWLAVKSSELSTHQWEALKIERLLAGLQEKNFNILMGRRGEKKTTRKHSREAAITQGWSAGRTPQKFSFHLFCLVYFSLFAT